MSTTRHPSHATRASDAGSFDEVCVRCGRRDVAGDGWGSLAEPCYVPLAENWTETLPALMRPEHKLLYLRADFEVVRAFLEDFKARRIAAEAALFSWMDTVGAVAYSPLIGVETHPNLFWFNEKPTGKGWKVLPQRASDKGLYKAVFHKKNAEAAALREALEALPPLVRDAEIAAYLNAIYSISYRNIDSEQMWGGSGSISGFAPEAALEWAGDTFIVQVFNPNHKLADMVESAKRSAKDADIRWQFSGSRYGSPEFATFDVPGWRPREGFTLISKAQRDLIFAQFRVDQEAEGEAA